MGQLPLFFILYLCPLLHYALSYYSLLFFLFSSNQSTIFHFLFVCFFFIIFSPHHLILDLIFLHVPPLGHFFMYFFISFSTFLCFSAYNGGKCNQAHSFVHYAHLSCNVKKYPQSNAKVPHPRTPTKFS